MAFIFTRAPRGALVRSAPSRAGAVVGTLALLLLLVGCGGETPSPSPVAPTPTTPTSPATPVAPVPSRGDASALDLASWNIEWFGDVRNGPTDEGLQLRNARAVIAGTDADLWGVAEIVSQQQWDSLEVLLPGHAGLLAGEPSVAGGAAAYTVGEQQVGVLYKTSVATLLGARIILAEHDFAFAGRPPLEARFRVTLNGASEELVVVVLHAKAFDDTVSWTRRRDAGVALKAYLDATYPTQKVAVIGDWNDDVDVSITAGRASPYQPFVADSARYRFPTAALSAARVSSTTRFPDLIDHHLVTNELAAAYVAGSATVYRLDEHIAGYAATTSDHYPVLTRYRVGAGARR